MIKYEVIISTVKKSTLCLLKIAQEERCISIAGHQTIKNHSVKKCALPISSP